MPGVGRRNTDILGEHPVVVHTQDSGSATDVSVAGTTLIADAADNVALGGDEVANLGCRDMRANLDNLAAHLVPNDQGWLDTIDRPGIPAPDVQVGSADRDR